ncbi:M23 family metallopeptidase [Catellatospora sp. KI3]|uniref:M23 family metallopeptidase n=1 Tax=Catellatospora sp. KI3 TaxID=3041620 RepID=UPI0024826C64|nr:M23 family metallopeptidase [Catellatospora sp. KI3]MDI1465412.1 M23 family metallopeptidase [Catellatospora sp. KI3]
MTVYQATRARRRARRRARVLLGTGVALAVLAGTAAVMWFWPAGPRPPFQLPVACGEKWQLGTYPGHGDNDVDLFPMEGRTAWGRPVLASYDGEVVAAGVNGSLGGRTPQNPQGPRGSGGGYWVKIDHGGRWETAYLHLLEPPLVRVGQRVRQGEQIGKVGSTGDSGAPHLHYEQRRGFQKTETVFDGVASGITTDDREYSVLRVSANCAPAR